MIKERLKEIIKELREVKNSREFSEPVDTNAYVLMSVSDEVIFQEACSFLRGELANENHIKNNSWKFEGTPKVDNQIPGSHINTSAGKRANPSPATKSQLDYLAKNNIDHNAEIITKQDAFLLIKKHKERR